MNQHVADQDETCPAPADREKAVDHAAGPDYDVVVVKYGPVGQAVALMLGRAGHRVAVLDRWPDFYPMPRAVHFEHEVARIFQSVGLRPGQTAAIEPYDNMYALRNADRETLLLVDWSGVGPTGWHTSNFFNQPELDALVREQPTVEVQRGWEAVRVTDDGDHATVTAARPGTGGTRELPPGPQQRAVTHPTHEHCRCEPAGPVFVSLSDAPTESTSGVR